MDKPEHDVPWIEATAKEKHDFLVPLLKEIRSAIVDFIFKQCAVLTLVMGWVLSSKDAQHFIATTPLVRFPAAAAIAILSLLVVFWIWNYRNRSQRLYDFLIELRYMPAHLYSTVLITKRFAISLISIHAIGSIVLITCLLSIRQ